MSDVRVLRREFAPAAVGSDETKVLFQVRRGERVLATSALTGTPAAAASTPIATLGDGSDVDGFVTAANLDLEAASGTLADGTGAYLANAGGKLYTADDTIDVTYTAGATPGATVPRLAFTIVVRPEWRIG